MEKDEDLQIDENINICNNCWKLLQNPITALPLIRGDLSISLRGKMKDEDLQIAINKYMDILKDFKRPG